MKLTIIIPDKAVYKDELSYINLVWSGTPDDVRVLQWDTNSGWIEYKNHVKPNEFITELPAWTSNAIAAWDVANAQEGASL